MKPTFRSTWFILATVVLIVCAGGLLSGFQNAGNTGTFTAAQPVFINQTATTCSAIVKNIGQSSHFLQYYASGEAGGFAGSIDLEESFDSLHWTQMALANLSIGTGDSGILQAGGYYQNVRSCITVTSGTLSAWYSSSSGPVAFTSPATNSVGTTSPTACDLSVVATIASGATVQLIAEGSRTLAVCEVLVSFDAATAAGNVQLGFRDPPPAADCTGFSPLWQLDTLATTPQVLPYGAPLGAFTRAPAPARGMCGKNTSGANLTIAISYTRL
ncbi:MAG: hypothetical protein ACRD20_02380 [Terriglobales bacterium]